MKPWNTSNFTKFRIKLFGKEKFFAIVRNIFDMIVTFKYFMNENFIFQVKIILMNKNDR